MTMRAMTVTLIVGVVFAMGCHTTDANDALPPGTSDPSTYNTPSGAVEMARGAADLLRKAVGEVVQSGGWLTDEVDSRSGGDPTNLRSSDPENVATAYTPLQILRGQASIARGMLQKYAPNMSPALRAEMYALEGYADIYLADLYCSGVPLSTVDFEQDFTYQPGSSTAAVYRIAAALLDTAVTLSHDSLRIETLARVGLGRALLALGQRDSAARVVATVHDTATYAVRTMIGWCNPAICDISLMIADREGRNGLPFVSANDPRVPITIESATNPRGSYTFPAFTRYLAALIPDSVTVTIANGVEARLIEAEAQLAHGGNGWLHMLNRLRTDSTFTTAVRRDPATSDSIGVDTTWNAGLGSVAGLPPLADPGSDSARLSLVFRERAFWLFYSGHRQGDLRRLVRASGAGGYGRPQSQEYPIGLSRNGYPYGSAVDFSIPDAESRNPRFKGCLNHDA